MEDWELLPEKFLLKLEELAPKELHNEIVESFCHAKPVSIRINTLLSSKEAVIAELQAHHIAITPVSWYEDAFLVDITDKKLLTDMDIYKQGHFYIQNLSSMLPALVLNPKPNETVLDLCAAPGSKTTQMAMMMQNSGKIVANDRSRQRNFKLLANLKEQGVTNTTVMSKPGEIFWKFYPNYFDKVLVYAPCSMEGRFLATDTATFEDWSPKKVKMLSQSQKWLLRSAVTATKPGGTIVYSTCTLSPEENEEVLDWLLKTEPYPLTIEPIHIPQLSSHQGLTSWNKHTFSDSMRGAMRIFPNTHMEGFFVAKITKHI